MKTVYLYGQIGWDIDASQFIKDMDSIKEPVLLRIHSAGGSVVDGFAIYNNILHRQYPVTTQVDGLAASMASVIAMAGSETKIHKDAWLMIHNPWSMVVGNSESMRREADLLDSMTGTLKSVYVSKTGKSDADIQALMDGETWFNGNDAVANKFIGNVIDVDESAINSRAACGLIFETKMFKQLPDKAAALCVHESNGQFTARKLEQALRDAGASRKQAKAILANGLTGDEGQRDAEVNPINSANYMDIVDAINRNIKLLRS